MGEELYTIACDALPADARVVGFRGREGLSQLYEIAIGIVTKAPDFEHDDAVRARATLSAHLGGAGPDMVFNGILSSVELLHAWDDQALYVALLVPQLWDLTSSVHSRIFTDVSVIDIVKSTLTAAGLPSDAFTFNLQRTYPPREHVCQYKESDFAFLSRWMEREGLYYFFEHGGDREQLVITDNPSPHEPLRGDAVRYVALAADNAMADEALATFRSRSLAMPKRVRFADYDYDNPTLAVRGSAAVNKGGHGDISLYGLNFVTPSEAERYATVRAESVAATRRVAVGRGRVFNLRSGYTFALDEHPRAALNTEYLVTELWHVGNQAANEPMVKELLELEGDDEYVVTLHAIPADVPFRAPVQTPWPRVDGYEHATVCGKAQSAYAQIDDQGRYRVRIKFDEGDLVDGSASTWVRMMQPHGGTHEGFHMPLRKATEVLVWFLDGDPDRPVIAGVVPNKHTPSPVVAHNHSYNVIQTGGLNRIEMRDDDGLQHIHLSTPPASTFMHMGAPDAGFHFILSTTGNAYEFSGGNWKIQIDGEKSETVVQDVSVSYESNERILVGGNRNETVDGDVIEFFGQNHTWTVDGDQGVLVTGDRTDVINGNVEQTIGIDNTIDIGSNWTIDVGGDHKLTVEGDQKITVGGSLTEKVGSDVKETYGGNLATTVAGNCNLDVTGPYKVTSDSSDWLTKGITSSLHIGIENKNLLGGSISATVGAKVDLLLGVSLKIHLGPAFENAPFKSELKSSKLETIQLKIAYAPMTLKQGVMSLHSRAMSIFT